MTQFTLSTPIATVTFPAGTVDTPWAFHVSGTLADGTPYGGGIESSNSTVVFDLAPGTYTLVVEKNDVKSLPSDPFTVDATPGGGTTSVELSVPDATQKAVIVPPAPAAA